jgi:NiFe hydrogenase small subunit HydA
METDSHCDGCKTLVWLQSGGCGGCTLSLLCAEAPDLISALDASRIRVLLHPSLSEAAGAEALKVIDDILDQSLPLDILCVEGAVMRGPAGTGRFHVAAGAARPMMDIAEQLAQRAGYVVAVGSCAAYGGITAAGDGAADACGLSHDGRSPGGLLGAAFRSLAGLPVINIAGCPVHPNWVVETLLQISLGSFTEADLDPWGRPAAIADNLVHHGCPRNEFYEFKASAEHLSELGCLMENLGCKGTQACADCNRRPWNGEGSCLKGGYPCIACTEPGFESPGHPFFETPKFAGIPVGLPADMPKAWFVALACLAKAATPERLKKNATADRILVSPVRKEGET